MAIALLILVLSVVFTTAQYRRPGDFPTIGTPIRRPLINDCVDLADDCVKCIKLGCFYYTLNPVFHKTLCYPHYLPPPLYDLILAKYQNEANCTEMDQPTTFTPQLKIPDAREETGSITTVIVITAIILGIIFGIGGCICFYKCARRSSRSVDFGPRQINNRRVDIPLNNLLDGHPII